MNKFVKTALACLLFGLCTLVVYYVVMRFTRVDVVFYSSLVAVLVATLLTGAALGFSGFLRGFSALEKAQLACIWLLAGYAFAISVPTVIDRSLSFYLLEKLEQRGGGIREDRFDDVFTKEYMHEHRLVDVRLTEQLESGTITIADGCVKLTPRGYRLAGFSRFFRANLLPKQRLLKGQYTDDLTNPFRNSWVDDPDYLCR